MDEKVSIYFVILHLRHLLLCDTRSHTPQEMNMQSAEITRTGCRGEYRELRERKNQEAVKVV